MNRFVTTLSLAETLVLWKLTIVGILRTNKTCISQETKPSNSRPLLFEENQNGDSSQYDTQWCYDLGCITPKMILFYIKTKAGVDTMDQMRIIYSTRRRTCRWSLVFYNILDITGVTAYGTYYENNDMCSILVSGKLCVACLDRRWNAAIQVTIAN